MYNKILLMPLSAAIVLFLLACTKEKIQFDSEQNSTMVELTGDTSILLGSWDWAYSEHDYNWCDPPSSFEILSPGTEGINFSVEFFRNGVVFFYKDYKLIAIHQIIFRDFTMNSPICNSSIGTKLFIYLDGNEEKTFSACMYGDTMRTGFDGFIFASEPGCESYANYFVKE